MCGRFQSPVFQAPTCFGFGYFTPLLYSVVIAEGWEGGDLRDGHSV